MRSPLSIHAQLLEGGLQRFLLRVFSSCLHGGRRPFCPAAQLKDTHRTTFLLTNSSNRGWTRVTDTGSDSGSKRTRCAVTSSARLLLCKRHRVPKKTQNKLVSFCSQKYNFGGMLCFDDDGRDQEETTRAGAVNNCPPTLRLLPLLG